MRAFGGDSLVLVVVLALAAAGVQAQAPARKDAAPPEQVLGVVEEIEPVQDDTSAAGEPLVTRLRAAFVRAGGAWGPACQLAGVENERLDCAKDLDAPAKWTVSHRARRLGEVATAGWYDTRRYRTMGVLKLGAGEVPRVGQRTMEFAGSGGDAVYRPLLAATRPRLRQPAGWREAPVSREDLAAAVALFAPYMPRLPLCASDAPADSAPALAPEHFEGIVALVSATGERAFGVRLQPRLQKDCDAMPSVEWSDFWLYARGKGPAQLLSLSPMKDTAMRFALVDWGDFDGDGKVDAVFKQSTADEDGYVLVHGNFEHLVRATWPNH